MNRKPAAMLSALLMLTFAIHPVFSQDKSGAESKKSPDKGTSQPALTFVGASLMVWYDGDLTGKEAIKTRDNSRAWAKYVAGQAGIDYEEYSIRDERPGDKGEPSPKDYYYSRVANAKAWVDNLEAGDALAVRLMKTSNNKSVLSQPIPLGGPVGAQELLDPLLKPVMEFSQKKKGASNTAPASPEVAVIGYYSAKADGGGEFSTLQSRQRLAHALKGIRTAKKSVKEGGLGFKGESVTLINTGTSLSINSLKRKQRRKRIALYCIEDGR